MRFEKGHKEATRQRIIAVASEKFRKEGVAAVGIAGLMADAGLTHGGFYAHFDSKEDLVREALIAALDGTRDRLDRQAKQGGDSGLEAYIRNYLRPAHRDTPEKGCAIAALGTEIARHSPETRAVFTEKLEMMVARLAAKLPEALTDEARTSTATGIVAVILGALQLSRTVSDAELSDRILESGIRSALALAG